MKSIQTLALLLSVSLFFSCGNSTGNTDAGADPSDTSAIAADKSASDENVMTVTAKFVEFSLGDASHFVFEDESGKTWDFGGNEDPNYAFAAELPANEADETNQGWGSDTSLQGKWFVLKYVNREQPQYQDGPMAQVPVILEAKLKE